MTGIRKNNLLQIWMRIRLTFFGRQSVRIYYDLNIIVFDSKLRNCFHRLTYYIRTYALFCFCHFLDSCWFIPAKNRFWDVGGMRKGLGLRMEVEILGRDLFGLLVLQFIRTHLSSLTHSFVLMYFEGKWCIPEWSFYHTCNCQCPKIRKSGLPVSVIHFVNGRFLFR